jgi:hypothetical protein
METPKQRRRDDVPLWLWRLECAEYGPDHGPGHDPGHVPAAPRSRASFWQEAQEESGRVPSGESADHAFLLEKEGGERVLFLGDRIRRLHREGSTPKRLPWLQADPTESEGPDVPPESTEPRFSEEDILDLPSASPGRGAEEEVAEEVASWRAERDLQRRRMSMAKSFLVFTERMHRSRKRTEVLDALEEMAHEVLDSSTTLLYLRERGSEAVDMDTETLVLRPPPELTRDAQDLGPIPVRAMSGLCGPTVLTQEMLEAGEEPDLAPLLDAMRSLNAASAALVPLGPAGLLVVMERRQGRAFDDEDCFFLRSIARTAEERLAKVHSGIR